MNKNRLALRLLSAATVALATLALAATPVADKSDEIKRTLQSRYPTAKIDQVTPFAQFPGMYEVISDNEIAYTDSTGNFVFTGKVIDTRTQESLTALRWNELHAADFSSLPLDQAIVTVRGSGARKIAIFADPDCPYCQKLEQELRQVDNITIYTFLFPLTIHPDAHNKAVKIWCSSDREAAWSGWMLERKPLQSAACDAPVIDSNIKLGQKLRIGSTPTMFLSNGQRVEGTLPHEQLEAKLAAAATPRK